ncbi:hypothetical protein [Pelagibius sp. Alg239-R121]|uniref:hypothetical protein n=1 Tax=Pelagibius sp. Alg239-R121 TaxID=2993448 RepID=UPI0024A76EDB|nr:hypothetical protein [Pelagibius sp. Alg239-R121]
MRRSILVVLLAVALGGCGVDLANYKYAALETTPQAIGSTFTATPAPGWKRVTSDLDQDSQINWSAGEQDNRVGIRFWYDLNEDDALFRHVDPDFPLFRPDMSPAGVMAMFKESLEFRNLREVETTNLRAAAFGNADGFRFDTSFRLPNDISVRGTVLAAILGDKLQLISYSASPELFEEYLGDADAIMNSVELQ